jgi:phosphoribosylanthranilate isomerase
MIDHIPEHISSVGVMQNPTLVEVMKVLRSGLSMIQLHGTESPAFCQQIKDYRVDTPIIKVFTESTLSSLSSYQGVIDIVLLDHQGGGAGVPIDWTIIPKAKEFADRIRVPLWIAGGLDESNLATLCHQYKIDGVDLSSGIEVNGIKDEAKMRGIIERMTQYSGEAK